LFSVANKSRISQVDDATKARDGLFISKGPTLVGGLLHSEGRTMGVDDDDAREEALGFGAVGNTTGELHKVKHAARITQRLLRDLADECREGRLRELWQSILQSSPSTAQLVHNTPEDTTTNTYASLSFLERNPFHDPSYPAPVNPLDTVVLPNPRVPPRMPGMDPVGAEKENQKPTGGTTSDKDTSGEDIGSASLTKEANEKLDVARHISIRSNAVARFDMINDPVDEAATQVLMPDCSRMYGGSLGQWGHSDMGVLTDEFAKEIEVQKLGHTEGVTDKHSRPRSILRVRASQMSLVTHPYLNGEERLFIELKRVYSHYRALFEHRSILYLCRRLVALLTQMRKLDMKTTSVDGDGGEGADADDDEERLDSLAALLRDFSETLPLLLQVQTAMCSLSSGLYDVWKDLKKARREQGCVCSRAVLVARELTAAGGKPSRSVNSAPGSANNSRPGTPGAAEQDGEDRPLLGRGGASRSDKSRGGGGDNSDSSDDDEEGHGHGRLAGDVAQYKEEIRVFRQFVKLLDGDVVALVKSVQAQLFVVEKAHIDAVAFQTGGDATPSHRRSGDGDDLEENSFHHHKHADATVDEQLQAIDARNGRLVHVVESAVRDLRGLARSSGSAATNTARSSASTGSSAAKALSFFPNVVFRLSSAGAVTPDKDVSIVERKRRAAIACTEFTLKVRVNGEQLPQQSASATVAYPSLTVHFNKSFELHVYHSPADLCLDVYLRLPTTWAGCLPSALGSSLVASVGVPLPVGSGSAHLGLGCGDTSAESMIGDARSTRKMAPMKQATLAAVFAPAAGWLMFSSRQPIDAPSIRLSSFGLGQEGFSADPEYLSAAIYCVAEYSLLSEHPRHPLLQFEGIHKSDLGLLPATPAGIGDHSSGGGDGGALSSFNFNLSSAPPAALLRAAGSLSANTRSDFDGNFVRERDFQKLLPSVDELDVYDPRNEAVLSILQSNEAEKNSLFTHSDVFRLYGQDFAVAFEDDAGIGLSNFMKLAPGNRMKLLQLRNYKPHLFTAPIPLSEAEIRQSELYRGLLGSIVEDKAPPNLMLGAVNLADTQGLGNTLRSQMSGTGMLGMEDDEDEDLSDPLVDSLAGHSNGNKISNFMDRVRDVHLNLEKGRSHKQQNLTTGDVVAETDYYFEFEFFELEKVIPDRVRSLKPTPKTRTPQAIQVGSASLLVQVVGCKNVPLRMLPDTGSARNRRATTVDGTDNTMHANFRGGEVAITNNDTLVEDNIDVAKRNERQRACTFVEVNFQENSVRTTSIAGSTPFWKQTLSLPFRPPQNDFAPAKLQQVREVVNFAVFDEIVENDKHKGGYLEGESTVRVERRYLGYISVPFLTIYETGRIDGVFRLNTPIFNFGYDCRAPLSASLTTPDLGIARPPSLGDVLTDCMGGLCGAMGVHTPLGTLITNATGGLLGNFEQEEEPGGEANIRDHGVYMHSATKAELEHFASDSDATYIKLMITMDPLLATSGDVTGSGDGRSSASQVCNLMNEDKHLGAFATAWLQEAQTYAAHTLRRSYKLFGTTSSGQKAFLCRFLCPQAPPASLSLTTRRSLLHFVSLVPFIPNSQVSLGADVDLWCTTRQCLEMGAGDEEEHAILLHNYLLHHATQGNAGGGPDSGSIEIYLALGSAIPEGDKAVYILLRDKNKQGKGAAAYGPEAFLLINPCEGYVYSAADPNCPLHVINTLVACDNVYANLQLSAKPNKLRFDMLDAQSPHWRPFFGSRFEFPRQGLSTIQAPVEYFPTSQHYANDIEKAVRQAVKTAMRRWRSRRQSSATTFHPDGSASMHDVLPLLEDFKRTGRITDEKTSGDTPPMAVLQSLIRSKMKALLKTRTLRGYPLNTAFTEIDDVIEKVGSVVHTCFSVLDEFRMSLPIYVYICLVVFIGKGRVCA